MNARSIFVALFLTIALAAASAHGGSPPGVTTAPVISLETFTPVPDASSTIVRTDNGANFSLHTDGLPPGHVVTLWLVIFNDPGACAIVHGCTLSDLGTATTQSSVIYGAGRVIGGDGSANYAGRIAVGNLNRPSALPDDRSGCSVLG